MKVLRSFFGSQTAAAILAVNIIFAPLTVAASENGEDGISYDQVASEEEQVKAQEVGVEGMFPVYGTDVKDGVYEVRVESSSSMFRVESASLTVHDGEMKAVLTMGGTGYLRLYMGTGVEAAKSDVSEYIEYQ